MYEQTDIFDYIERTPRLHRGVETSREAARKVAIAANSDAMRALELINEHGGLTYKQINAIVNRDIQPRVSCLEADGYIKPLLNDDGTLVKKDGCRVMVVTYAGMKVLA